MTHSIPLLLRLKGLITRRLTCHQQSLSPAQSEVRDPELMTIAPQLRGFSLFQGFALTDAPSDTAVQGAICSLKTRQNAGTPPGLQGRTGRYHLKMPIPLDSWPWD